MMSLFDVLALPFALYQTLKIHLRDGQIYAGKHAKEQARFETRGLHRSEYFVCCIQTN